MGGLLFDCCQILEPAAKAEKVLLAFRLAGYVLTRELRELHTFSASAKREWASRYQYIGKPKPLWSVLGGVGRRRRKRRVQRDWGVRAWVSFAPDFRQNFYVRYRRQGGCQNFELRQWSQWSQWWTRLVWSKWSGCSKWPRSDICGCRRRVAFVWQSVTLPVGGWEGGRVVWPDGNCHMA